MNNLIHHSLTVFLSFFAIMNPIANTAVFLGLTSNQDSKERKKIAGKALITSFFIILLFAIFGKATFHLFSISLPALRIAGGVLVFMIGYNMLHGSSSKMHTSDGNEGTDISISPLAVPLLAGPGTIATAMSFSADGGWTKIIITMVSFLVLCIITFICFVSGEKLLKFIGKGGMEIITKLMGLILAVIGVQMLIEGIRGAIEL